MYTESPDNGFILHTTYAYFENPIQLQLVAERWPPVSGSFAAHASSYSSRIAQKMPETKDHISDVVIVTYSLLSRAVQHFLHAF